MTDIDLTSDDELPSRTRRKKDAEALQTLGEHLTTLPEAKLLELPVSEIVIRNIKEFKRLPNSYGARKRQLQYIGRLMRDCDYDAITSALEQLNREPEPNKNSVNEWYLNCCQRLLSEGSKAIEELLASYPDLDRQKLRQLVRAHEKTKGTKQEAYKKRLLEYLQQMDIKE